MKASVGLSIDPDEKGFESNWVDAPVRPRIHSRRAQPSQEVSSIGAIGGSFVEKARSG